MAGKEAERIIAFDVSGNLRCLNIARPATKL
jgi:hypothetical protein